MDRGYSLQALAEFLGAELRGDPSCTVYRLNTLQDAKEGELSFLANKVYKRYLKDTSASAVILSQADAESFLGNRLICDNPYLAYAQLSKRFDQSYSFSAGVHQSSVVDESARVDPSAFIGAGAVISSGAIVGADVFIGSGVFVGEDSQIGEGSYIHPNVTIYQGVSIGCRTIVHSGAVIGADGFGHANNRGLWVKIHQLGGVEIGDDVEIGACTTIDRGALGNTKIGNGVIIDNLVQIAHNVEVGDNSALAGCSAISGSSTLGKHCVLAGGAGLVGHIDLCDGVVVTARTMVTKSITEPGTYSSGTPFEPNRQWRKNAVRFSQLDGITKRLSALEKGQSRKDD